MYFLLRKEALDTPDLARSKPYWQVCEAHSSISLEEIVAMAARQQLITGYADNERQMESRYDYCGIMTERL